LSLLRWLIGPDRGARSTASTSRETGQQPVRSQSLTEPPELIDREPAIRRHELFSWEDAGFDALEATEWQNRGFAVNEAQKWKGLGATAQEAGAFRHANIPLAISEGIVYPRDTEAMTWYRHGFTAKQARSWSAQGFQVHEAKRWRDAGFLTDVAAVLGGSGFTPEKAAATWLNTEFNHPDVKKWVENGVREPTQARRWIRFQFDVSTATAWAKAGVTNPLVASELRDAGSTPEIQSKITKQRESRGAELARAARSEEDAKRKDATRRWLESQRCGACGAVVDDNGNCRCSRSRW
jgi:hypothetical protein